MKKKYDECLLSHLVDPNFNAHEQWLFSIQIISFAMRLNNLMPKKTLMVCADLGSREMLNRI